MWPQPQGTQATKHSQWALGGVIFLSALFLDDCPLATLSLRHRETPSGISLWYSLGAVSQFFFQAGKYRRNWVLIPNLVKSCKLTTRIGKLIKSYSCIDDTRDCESLFCPSRKCKHWILSTRNQWIVNSSIYPFSLCNLWEVYSSAKSFGDVRDWVSGMVYYV